MIVTTSIKSRHVPRRVPRFQDVCQNNDLSAFAVELVITKCKVPSCITHNLYI